MAVNLFLPVSVTTQFRYKRNTLERCAPFDAAEYAPIVAVKVLAEIKLADAGG